MNNPLVSIIVPSYKRKPDLVRRAINSLLNQTYDNIEIILVDDNGGDGLIEYRDLLVNMVSEINSSKLIYIQNEKNLGGSLTRNHGISCSHGEYITFLDDDDKYEPEKIEHQLSFMLDQNIDVCISDLSIYDERDKLIDYRDHKDIERFDKEYLFKYHLTKQIAGTPTFMYKAIVLNKIGGFDEAVTGQEFFLFSKTIQADVKIGYFPESNIRAYRYDIEAISTGKEKIIGEKKLYKYKKKYFDILNFKERNYIRCRHYAVMAVAYKRNKKIIVCLGNLFVAFCLNPLLSIKEALNLNKRKKENLNVTL